MRRFKKIFKRSSKSEAESNRDSEPQPPPTRKTPGFFRSLSSRSGLREPAEASSSIPQVPTLPVPPQTYSSSSSSTDSPSPPTPDEESPCVSSSKSPWLPEKKAISLDTSFGWDAHTSSKSYAIPARAAADDSEDDRSSATSSSSHSVATSASIPRSIVPIAYALSITTNSLMPSFSSPPLLNLPGIPLFPRSCNSLSSLSFQESTESMLHRTRMLRKLERRELSQAEEHSLAPFASRRAHPPGRAPSIRLDDDAVKDIKRISRTSIGLKAWASRRCFEDRMVVYTQSPGQIITESRVAGTKFAVPELEISSALETLAGLFDIEPVEEAPLPSSQSSSSSLSLAPAHTPRTQSYKPNPSPLRLEAISSSPPALPPVALSPTSPAFFSGPRRVKNSVRFDVEDKVDRDDEIPLGQIIHIKKGKEDKAKFLALERERRVHEEERLRHEAEKMQWEREKQAWEAEKRAIEEEKKKKHYAEEVVAARKRRESQMYSGPGSSSDLADSPEFLQQRTTSTYSRPHYDTRRQGSEPGQVDYRHSFRDESPASSGGTSRTRVDSRPPSLHSSHTFSSAEDVRHGGRGGGSRRGSVFSESPKAPSFIMQPQYVPVPYMWTGVPPVPTVPYMYLPPNTDLLPPTAPFMMQGNRRRSFNSSPSRDSVALSTSHSAERLPPPKRQMNHQRHSSGEVTANKRMPTSSQTPSAPVVAPARGRAQSSRPPPPQTQPPPQNFLPSAPSTIPRSYRRQTAIT